MTFNGENTGVGSWTCMKDRDSTCQHVLLAQSELQDILEVNGNRVEEWHELTAEEGVCLYWLYRKLVLKLGQ